MPPETKLELHIYSAVLLYCLQHSDGFELPINGLSISQVAYLSLSLSLTHLHTHTRTHVQTQCSHKCKVHVQILNMFIAIITKLCYHFRDCINIELFFLTSVNTYVSKGFYMSLLDCHLLNVVPFPCCCRLSYLYPKLG